MQNSRTTRTLGTLVALAIAGCSVRTYYVKESYNESVDRQVRGIAWMMPAHQEDIGYSFSCIDSERLQGFINSEHEFEEIRNDPQLQNGAVVVDTAAQIVHDARLDCARVTAPPVPPTICAAPPVSPEITATELMNPTAPQLYGWLEGTGAGEQPWKACLRAVSGGENGNNLCESAPGSHIEYPPLNEWAFTARRMLCDNRGLFREWSSLGPRDITIATAKIWFPHDRQVAAAFGPDSQALLAMSARNMPAAESKKGFAGLPERAQAAAISAAASGGKGADGADPGAVVKALTKEEAAPFAASQRVEVTLSGGLNSASIRDRFDYLDAYLSVAPLAGRLNGRVSLERELLRRFAAHYYARSPLERITHDKTPDLGVIRTDLRMALDELSVHIEAVDTTATQATLINLGTLTSAGSLTASVGPAGLVPASGAAQLSATRADNIAKELDRRGLVVPRTNDLEDH